MDAQSEWDREEWLQRQVELQAEDNANVKAKKTLQAYNQRIGRYKKWCEDKGFEDSDRVTTAKTVAYMRTEVMAVGNTLMAKRGIYRAVGHETIQMHIKALTDLYQFQNQRGENE